MDEKRLDEIMKEADQINRYLNEMVIKLDNNIEELEETIVDAQKILNKGLTDNPHINITWIDKTNMKLLELKHRFPTLKDKIMGITRDFTLLIEKIEKLVREHESEKQGVPIEPDNPEDESEEQPLDTSRDDSIGEDEERSNSEDGVQPQI